jgi:hypothetical protein
VVQTIRTEPSHDQTRELDELAALHAAIRETPDDPAERAQRSAAAYLDARRARLRRELRGV